MILAAQVTPLPLRLLVIPLSITRDEPANNSKGLCKTNEEKSFFGNLIYCQKTSISLHGHGISVF